MMQATATAASIAISVVMNGASVGSVGSGSVVTASADGYSPQTEPVTVLESSTVTRDFTLQAIPTYTVSGTVTDTDDIALEGATVTIEGTRLSAVTDDKGNYIIPDVEEGTYDITASKEGYSSQTKPVTVGLDDIVNFVLNKITVTTLNVDVTTDKTVYSRNSWVYITVTVTDNGDPESPIAGAKVDITVCNPDDSVVAGTGTTNSNGIAQFRYRVMPKAPTGEYTVEATAALAEYETGTGETTFEVV